jgi:hypothetical protein
VLRESILGPGKMPDRLLAASDVPARWMGSRMEAQVSDARQSAVARRLEQLAEAEAGAEVARGPRDSDRGGGVPASASTPRNSSLTVPSPRHKVSRPES